MNTSAQNVIVWKSKLGRTNLKDFTYKNIIGRGGRMFKYVVRNLYLMDAPPRSEDTQLETEFPEEILGRLDEEQDSASLTDRQVERIVEYRTHMSSIIGIENFERVRRQNLLQDSDADFLLRLATDMKENPDEWRGFGYLNSSNPAQWDSMLYRILKLSRALGTLSTAGLLLQAFGASQRDKRAPQDDRQPVGRHLSDGSSAGCRSEDPAVAPRAASQIGG